MCIRDRYFNIVPYGVNDEGYIDYDELERIAVEAKPKLIIAGASAYCRTIDFKRFREVADKVGAYLMVDMAHIAGLVAAGLHPSPIPYADVVTTTTVSYTHLDVYKRQIWRRSASSFRITSTPC